MTIPLFASEHHVHYLHGGVYVAHTMCWLPAHDEGPMFKQLLHAVQWSQESIMCAGIRVPIPRLTAWFGEKPYTYSGVVNVPQPPPSALVELRERVATTVGTEMDSCLGNLYRDGDDMVGWHSDDESELDTSAPIVSVSLGAPRRFLMRHVSDRSPPKVEFVLGPGDLLVMGRGCQQHYQHCVPRQAGAGMRISLTFRRMR